MVILAFGTVEPAGSRIVPPMVPELSCADSTSPLTRIARQSDRALFIISPKALRTCYSVSYSTAIICLWGGRIDGFHNCAAMGDAKAAGATFCRMPSRARIRGGKLRLRRDRGRCYG